MTLISSSLDMINWLENEATTIDNQGYKVNERYLMDSSTWSNAYRPDCHMETAYAFLKAWQYTNNDTLLEMSRGLFHYISSIQKTNGSWPFTTSSTDTWTNDNGEVTTFLVRMAKIDNENSTTYINTAIKTAGYLLSIQNSDGSFPVYNSDLTGCPLFSAQAVSGLCHVYPYVTNKDTYRTAIENCLSWIATKIQSDYRVLTSWEITSHEEAWRPPTSDQSAVIRAFAHAEMYVGTDSSQVSTWKTNRQNMITWLNQCIDASGAVLNGLGQNITNADVSTVKITDHVYTTAFAIEAYLYSYYVDNNSAYLNTAEGIVNFISGNLYFSSTATPETNGILRGAYNLTNNNWDTSAVVQNSGQEGGGNVIYSGWANAPCAALLFETNSLINPPILNVDIAGEKIQIETILNSTSPSPLRMYLYGSIFGISLVPTTDPNAANLHAYINGQIQSLKKKV